MQLRNAWDYIAAGWHGEAQSDRLRQVLTALEARAGEFGTNPAELARWMADERRKEDDSECKVRAAAKAKEDTTVDIWTVHAAKGLEASVVYLPFLGRSSNPDATLCKNTFIFGFAEDGSEYRWIDTRLFLKGKALEDGAAEEATIQTDDKGDGTGPIGLCCDDAGTPSGGSLVA
jgi:ATP-dependent exoDNAse (exonuclease V) beta subunit